MCRENDDHMPPGKSVVKSALKRTAIIAGVVWIVLIALLAALIFLSPVEPMPMGYGGTFYVFALVGSIIFLIGTGLVLGVVAIVVIEIQRSRRTDGPRGFEVIPSPKEDAHQR
jgi:hypothetical protein